MTASARDFQPTTMARPKQAWMRRTATAAAVLLVNAPDVGNSARLVVALALSRRPRYT
jgi:hypothetical protein